MPSAHSRQRPEITVTRAVSVAQSAKVVWNLAESYTPENLLAKIDYLGLKRNEGFTIEWEPKKQGYNPCHASGTPVWLSLKFADVLG